MSTEKDRLRRLVRAGKLSAGEAAQIAQAFERLDQDARRAHTTASRKKRVSPAGELKARFLSGQIDADQFRSGNRDLAVRMGLLFGALMFPALWAIGPIVLLINEGALAALAAVAMTPFLLFLELPSSALMGLGFGLAMYHCVLEPSARKLSALQGQVDLGAEPLERTRPGQCPTCGAENKKSWTWKSPVMVHWVLNPGVAFNEVVLGQRVPREMHHCRECGTSFIDCPGCQSSVDAMDWSVGTQFGQWRGMRCVRCGGDIPVLRNVWGLLLEAPVRALRRALGASRGPDARRA